MAVTIDDGSVFDHSITAVAEKGLKLSANAQLLALHCCLSASSLTTALKLVKRVNANIYISQAKEIQEKALKVAGELAPTGNSILNAQQIFIHIHRRKKKRCEILSFCLEIVLN